VRKLVVASARDSKFGMCKLMIGEESGRQGATYTRVGSKHVRVRQ
jgi:hypothetical protein